jgi:glycosyltransferase involved in cell wall biosynthesis
MISSETENPLVSIVVPFLNREKFLGETIESVEAQSCENWELILVDDGSTDNSRAIAEQWTAKYPRKIFLFEHEQRRTRGASAARNLGLRRARGKYVVFLDSDDVFLPDALESQLNNFRICPEADAVCGALRFWYSWTEANIGGRERDFEVNLGLENDKLYAPPSLLVHNLQSGGRKPGINCVMVRRDFIERVGAFEDDYLHVGEDQIFWAKISLNGKIFVTAKCLAKYRQHADSSCRKAIAGGNETSSWVLFLNWLENYLNEEKIADENLLKAMDNFRRESRFQKKFSRLKGIYCRVFPLYARYWLRDRITAWRARRNGRGD